MLTMKDTKGRGNKPQPQSQAKTRDSSGNVTTSELEAEAAAAASSDEEALRKALDDSDDSSGEPPLDKKRPFAEVRGEPGVAYQQRDKLYNKHGKFVRKAEVPLYVPPPTRAELRRNEVKVRESKKKPVDPVPQAIKDAQKENAQAAAAETKAE